MNKFTVRPASQAKQIEVIPTGIATLDWLIGGFPKGQLSEVYGIKSVGKSLLSYYAMANAQRMGYKCLYMNIEGLFDKDWAAKSGLDLEQLDIADPNNGRECLRWSFDAVESGKYDFITFDSLGHVIDDSKENRDRDSAGKAGGNSLIVSNFVKELKPVVTQYNCVFLFLNQVRHQFGGSSQYTMYHSPGGETKDHTFANKIHLAKSTKIREGTGKDEVEVGFLVNAKIEKSKTSGSEGKKTSWNIYFDAPNKHGFRGIELNRNLLDCAINNAIIEKNGAWFTHPSFGEKPIQGSDGVFDFLMQNAAAREEIYNQVLNTAKVQIGNDIYELMTNGKK